MSENDEYEYIFKIILIGSSGVGKSSILQRYIQKTFNDSYTSTIGVDFFMKTINIGEKSIKLQLWDTAGTEKFRSITTGYYRGADAAFVVFDLSSKSSFKTIDEWIDNYYKYKNPDSEKPPQHWYNDLKGHAWNYRLFLSPAYIMVTADNGWHPASHD